MRPSLLPALLLTVALSSLARAETDSSYRRPSPALVAVVEAPLTPSVFLSPNKQVMLLAERSALPPVAELAQPELRIAGLRINPATSGPTREPYYTGLVVQPLAGGAESRVSGLRRRDESGTSRGPATAGISPAPSRATTGSSCGWSRSRPPGRAG